MAVSFGFWYNSAVFVQGSLEPVLLNLKWFLCLFSVCSPSGHLNSKFTTIEGFWVQFLQKSKLELKLNMTVVRENPVLPLAPTLLRVWNTRVFNESEHGYYYAIETSESVWHYKMPVVISACAHHSSILFWRSWRLCITVQAWALRCKHEWSYLPR